MKLLPFDPRMAEFFYKLYNDSKYTNFARGVRRLLTLEELSHLPQVLGMEILAVHHEDKIIAAVSIDEEAWGVYNWGVAIDEEFQRNGYSYEIEKLVCDYVFNKKGGRMIMSEVLLEDKHVAEAYLKAGYAFAGVIPEYHFANGKFRDVQFYYKRK